MLLFPLGGLEVTKGIEILVLFFTFRSVIDVNWSYLINIVKSVHQKIYSLLKVVNRKHLQKWGSFIS